MADPADSTFLDQRVDALERKLASLESRLGGPSRELPGDVVEDLVRLHMVRWDRWADGGNHLVVYGWIDRPDGRQDFVVLISRPEGVGYITSSAHWTERIGEILGQNRDRRPRGHQECRRVEVDAPGLPNVVRFAGRGGGEVTPVGEAVIHG